MELKIYKDIYTEGIDLITVNKYKDFTLTIYPLNKEEYLYENVIKSNNLSYADFKDFFNNYKYDSKSKIILVGLIEFKNVNAPINLINYFFYEYDESNNENNKEINKANLSNLDNKVKIEYFIHNYNHPNIIEDFSTNLISTIKLLNLNDIDISLSKENEVFFTDICTTFTSEVGTDMTLADRAQLYFTKLNLCENDCDMSELIGKGTHDNQRAVCDCKLKQKNGFSDDDYSYNYEKKEGENVANINVLKCAKKVFSGRELHGNFIFWIFLFIIFILFVIFLIILICGKSTVENILKIKKEIGDNEESQSHDNVDDISEKISSRYSGEKDQSLEVNNFKNKSKSRDIISPKNSSKISDSAPPKRKKEIISTKGENQFGSKTENSINTTINYNNKIEFKFKKEDEIFDEIFPDYNEVLNNNFYYENEYMKNNYVNLRVNKLDLKKNFLIPITKEDIPKYVDTDKEENVEDFNFYRKKRYTINYFQNLLPKADISEDMMEKNKENPNKSEDELDNKKYFLKKPIKFIEDSNFLGDDQIFPYEDNHNKTILLKNKKKKSIKNSQKLNINEEQNNILVIHKKKKSLVSSNISDEKKSNSSSLRSLNKKDDLKDSKNSLLDNYFLNSSSRNINIKIKYSFFKFYWIYLNKKEFCLASIYNLDDNIAIFIRISTFLFVISLIFTINTLFLTTNQIHERYIYTKKNGSKNEFTYIFKKEIAPCLICTAICIIIKMLFIKFIYNKLFRISHSAKEDLSPFGVINSEKDTNEEKNHKRELYLKKYRNRSLIYISIIFVIILALGYISICYFGIFKNTKAGMIVRFFISFVFSIILCAILCLIIVIIYHLGRKFNNKCLKTTYRWLNIIY